MDCCTRNINGLDSIFSERYVRREVKGYWKKGLEKRAQLIADQLTTRGVGGSTVLEVGCGFQEYRFYLHSPVEIAAAVEAAGLRRVFHQFQGVWHVAVYERAG